MNNKIVSVVLVAGIAVTGFAGISAASETSTSSFLKGNTEIKELFDKLESGETLSESDLALLDEAKAQRSEKGAKFGGKRKGGGNLTDEESTALEAMSDEERKEFFDAKKIEMKAKMQESKVVIDKLIAGENLTSAEETIRLEILAKFESEDNDHPQRRDGGDIIAKIVAGDELTADEETELAEMQAKNAQREAQRAIMEPIKVKLDAGEELSDEEQAVLDEMKANKPEGKMREGNREGEMNKEGKNGQRGQRGDREVNHDDMDDDIETDEDM